MPTKTIKSRPFERSILFDKSTIDKEARTVEISFSSEQPCERFIGGDLYDEVLDHSPDSVRLGRLTNGAPLLVGHNQDDQVGVVETAAIDVDRLGRSVVRFGRSQRANDIFNDVCDGIRQKVSVMYRIYSAVVEAAIDGNPVYRAFDRDWETKTNH